MVFGLGVLFCSGRGGGQDILAYFINAGSIASAELGLS